MSFVYSITGTPVQPSQVFYRNITLSANTTLQWPFNNTDSGDVVAMLNRVTATTGSLTITMPDGDAAANGYAVIFDNAGANTFTVLNASGGTITTVASGTQKYIALIDNSTADGTWAVYEFGASTSAANAMDLAGAGVRANAATLDLEFLETSIAASYVATVGDRALLYNWTGGSGTFTLPATATLGDGWFVIVRNSGSGTLTLTPAGIETIDGASTKAIAPTESAMIISTGTALVTFGYGRSNVFSVTRLVKSVAGSTDVTLTSTEAANKIIDFNGTLSGNINVNFPAVADTYWVKNSTSGAFSLTIRPTSGTGIAITQGNSQNVVSDGSTIYLADTAGTGTVTNIATGTGLTGGPITATGTISIATTGVGAGNYDMPSLSINAQGQATSAIDGKTASFVMTNKTIGASTFSGVVNYDYLTIESPVNQDYLLVGSYSGNTLTLQEVFAKTATSGTQTLVTVKKNGSSIATVTATFSGGSVITFTGGTLSGGDSFAYALSSIDTGAGPLNIRTKYKLDVQATS